MISRHTPGPATIGHQVPYIVASCTGSRSSRKHRPQLQQGLKRTSPSRCVSTVRPVDWHLELAGPEMGCWVNSVEEPEEGDRLDEVALAVVGDNDVDGGVWAFKKDEMISSSGASKLATPVH